MSHVSEVHPLLHVHRIKVMNVSKRHCLLAMSAKVCIITESYTKLYTMIKWEWQCLTSSSTCQPSSDQSCSFSTCQLVYANLWSRWSSGQSVHANLLQVNWSFKANWSIQVYYIQAQLVYANLQANLKREFLDRLKWYHQICSAVYVLVKPISAHLITTSFNN